MPGKTSPKDNKRQLSPRKQFVFRIMAVVLSVVALEAGARVVWMLFIYQPMSDQQLFNEVTWHGAASEESIPYTFPQNKRGKVAETLAITNNLGLRDIRQIDPYKKFEGTRIICLGDSVTFGYSVSDNDSAYPAVLEKLLAKELPDIQVLNAGMPRFRAQHSANFFEKHLMTLGPDVIVYLGGWNDVNDHILLEAEQDVNFLHLTADHCYMVKLVRHVNVLPNLGGTRTVTAEINQEGFEYYQRSLRSLISLSRRCEAKIALCTLPHFHEYLDKPEAQAKFQQFALRGTPDQVAEVSRRMNEQVLAVGEQENVPVINLGHINNERWFADMGHPNDEGSAMVASRVAEFLLNHTLSAGNLERGD